MLDIQNKLKKLGYLDGTVDGIYGGLTANAVKAFQGDQGISETGEIDEGTLDALSQAYADRPGDFSLARFCSAWKAFTESAVLCP